MQALEVERKKLSRAHNLSEIFTEKVNFYPHRG